MKSQKIIGMSLSMLIAFLVVLLLSVTTEPQTPRAYALAPTRSLQLSNNGIMCDRPDEVTGDCITLWNGGDVSIYNNQGGGLMFSIDGGSGDLNTLGALTVRGTPVTNQVRAGTTPAAAKQVCKSVNIIGAATVTAPGITTPAAVTYGLGANPSADASIISHVNVSGVVTVSVWGAVATPATTVVPVDVCIVGN